MTCIKYVLKAILKRKLQISQQENTYSEGGKKKRNPSNIRHVLILKGKGKNYYYHLRYIIHVKLKL